MSRSFERGNMVNQRLHIATVAILRAMGWVTWELSEGHPLPEASPYWRAQEFANIAMEALAEHSAPIDMVLYCPECFEQHIDKPQPEKGWDNPPHRSHECQVCEHVWRPADVPTNGVEAIKTKGQRDGFTRR